MAANEKQVGGDHYQHTDIQHWDWSWHSKHDPFQYQITKYVDRHFRKNGLQDLLKAKHFLEKYIELLTGPGGKYQIQQPTYGDGVMEREWEHATLDFDAQAFLQDLEPGSEPTGPGYVDQDPDWGKLVGSPNSALPSSPNGGVHDDRYASE